MLDFMLPFNFGLFTGIFCIALLARWIHTILVSIQPVNSQSASGGANARFGQVALTSLVHPAPWLLLIVAFALAEGRKYVSGPAFHAYVWGAAFAVSIFIGMAVWIAYRFRADRKRRAGAV